MSLQTMEYPSELLLSFNYIGTLPSSKSLFNRALILKSFSPEISLFGESQADDVRLMRAGVDVFERGGDTYDCGAAGTVFRFLSLRVVRRPGKYVFKGTPRLLSRLSDEHKRALMQLGCEVKWNEDHIVVQSWGWRPSGDAIHVPAKSSSQLGSALLLSAWDLPQSLNLIFPRQMASPGYLDMTIKLVEKFGLKVERHENEIFVSAHQKISPTNYKIEPDLSCAFAVSAIAALFGRADILGLPLKGGVVDSLQPDSVFIDLLKKMNVKVQLKPSGSVTIEKPEADLTAISVDLNNAPDLFPVLCVLLSQCEGVSHVKGFAQVEHKESNRLHKTLELLKRMDVLYELLEDSLKIIGVGQKLLHENFFYFDPDQDHRMAMAAALVKKIGYRIEILNPECVNKSFPDFWSIAGVSP
jgi:3-phosphoshikimate 1-carboxyvinyltransferase